MTVKEVGIIISSIACLIIFMWLNYSNILLLLCINVLIFLWLFYREYDRKFIIILLIQWLMYVILLVIHQYFYALPGSGNDDLRFEELAQRFYINYLYSVNLEIFQNSAFYSQMISLFYLFGTPHILIPGLLNITVHNLTVMLLYHICVHLFKNTNVANISTIIYILYPLHITSTIITLREIYITFFILLFIYALLLYHRRNNKWHLTICVIAIGLGSLFHIGLLGLLLILAVYFMFLSAHSAIIRVFLVLAIILGFIVLITYNEDSKLTSTLKNEQHLEPTTFKARADYLHINEEKNIQTETKQIIYFLVKPLPWEIRNFSDIIGVVNIAFILLGTYLAFKAYMYERNKDILIVLIAIYIVFIIFSLGTYNYGTALRHRDKVTMLFTMFISYYAFILRKR